jgi:hypothetical protein
MLYINVDWPSAQMNWEDIHLPIKRILSLFFVGYRNRLSVGSLDRLLAAGEYFSTFGPPKEFRGTSQLNFSREVCNHPLLGFSISKDKSTKC